MTALLNSLLAPADAASTQAIAADGLPGARSEAWKYTPLRALERRSFAPANAASVDASVLAHIHGTRLVLVNGQFDAALSQLDGLPEGVRLQSLSQLLAQSTEPRESNFLQARYDGSDEVFARINAALASDGMVLRVAEGVRVDAPLHLVSISTASASGTDEAWHLRHFIELRRDAALTIIEHHLHADANAHLSNALTHVHVAAGAQLTHLRLQDDAASATAVLRTDAVLARDAKYQRRDVELGAGLSRHELNIRLEGVNASADAGGVLLADGRRHLDTRLKVEHIAADTRCDLRWRGIGNGRGKVVFHGGITIRAGADGSDAQLSNKNLLLSDNADINTQPVLVIHADEVTAAHGATVGQLDANAMFYLRSRGIGAAQARSLLTAAFCHEVLGDDAPAAITQALDAALARQDKA